MRQKWIPFALKFLISGTLIWFLIRKIDLAAVGDRMLLVDPTLLFLAVLVMLWQYIIFAFRWGTVIEVVSAPLRFLETLRIVCIGAFFNQLLPSSVGGDAIRAFEVRRMGLSITSAINSVFLERVAVVASLIILVMLIQPFFLPKIDRDARDWMLLTVGLVAATMVVGLVALLILDRLPLSLQRWRPFRWLASLGVDARAVFLNPRCALRTMGWAFYGHINITLVVYLLARGMDLNVTMIDSLALFLPVSLVATLPISIAGWGVRENAMVVAFGLVGVTSLEGTALSLSFGILSIAVSLPGGIIWLVGSRRRKEKVEYATN